MLHSVPREDNEEDSGGVGTPGGGGSRASSPSPDGRSSAGLLKARRPLRAAAEPISDSGYLNRKSPEITSWM